MSLWARYKALPPRRRVLLGVFGLYAAAAGLLLSPKPPEEPKKLASVGAAGAEPRVGEVSPAAPERT